MKNIFFKTDFSNISIETLNLFISKLVKDFTFCANKKLCLFLEENNLPTSSNITTYVNEQTIDLVICIGGDGTVLRGVDRAVNNDAILLGINTGRLGFLSNKKDDDIDDICKKIKENKFDISERGLLEVKLVNQSIRYFCLNEIAVTRRENDSMILVDVIYQDLLIHKYWGDGVIFATPTGSTGYSLSCNGPIIDPDIQGTILITPIASHHINIRPVILGKDKIINIQTSARTKDFLLSIDTEKTCLPITQELTIRNYPKKLKLGYLNEYNYWSILKEKLHWGIDKRNL